MRLIRRFFSDSGVEKRYVSAGAVFGDAVSYIFLGESVGFESMLRRWKKWEEEYSLRGFRTISLDRFIDLGGYGKPLDDVINIKREEGEKPIFHAGIYREKFLGKTIAAVDLERMMNGEEVLRWKQYALPSTE